MAFAENALACGQASLRFVEQTANIGAGAVERDRPEVRFKGSDPIAFITQIEAVLLERIDDSVV